MGTPRKKNSSAQHQFEFTRLSSIGSAIAVIDSSYPGWERCRDNVEKFFADNSVKGRIFYFNIKKYKYGESLPTPLEDTMVTSDLSFFRRPSKKLREMEQQEADVLFMLAEESCPLYDHFISHTCAAFKIGSGEKGFDMAVGSKARKMSHIELFDNIIECLSKLTWQ